MRRWAQKYFCLAAAALAIAALPTYAQTANQPNLGPNLVKNDGFEDEVTDWNIPANTAKVVDDAAHSGTHSLYYSNTDAKQYKMFSQKIDVRPGQHVQFSAWVKGQGITGKEGVGIYVQSTDGTKYIGGSFPDTLKGTFDWKRVSGAYTIPPNANRTTVGLYLRKSVTGSAWFDDVEVRVEAPVSFSSFLQYPNYRGTVKQGDKTPWKFQIKVYPQPDWKTGSIKILNTLVGRDGKVLFNKSDEALPTNENVEVTLDAPRNLALGDYTLKQTITDPNGKVALENSYAIHVVKEMPKVYIDAQSFTVVDGKRFFPMGIYLNPTAEEDMARVSAGGFNTVLSYGYGNGKDPEAYLARAQNNDLKVIYSLKDMYPGRHGYGDEAFDLAAKHIKTLRDNPALLAWYTNDELDTNWMAKLHKTYDLVKQLDPDHPAFQVLYQMGILEKYFDVTDVLGTDPYPVGGANLTQTSTDTRLTIAATHGANGVWMVPQIMDWAVYKKENNLHPPSLDEMRNQAYQALINGATGLIWYQYYDLMYEKYPRDESTKNMELFHKRWNDVAAMAGEINKITPVVLENKKVLLDIPAKSDVEAAAWQDGDNLLIVFANPYYAEKSITFKLPAGWKISDADQGQIKSTFVDGKATFTLPSVGSGVFRLVKN